MSSTVVSYRNTKTLNGTAAHQSNGNGYGHYNGSAAAASSYHESTVSQGALMQQGGGGWLTANFVKLSACTAAGVVFGFATEKAKGMNAKTYYKKLIMQPTEVFLYIL